MKKIISILIMLLTLSGTDLFGASKNNLKPIKIISTKQPITKIAKRTLKKNKVKKALKSKSSKKNEVKKALKSKNSKKIEVSDIKANSKDGSYLNGLVGIVLAEKNDKMILFYGGYYGYRINNFLLSGGLNYWKWTLDSEIDLYVDMFTFEIGTGYSLSVSKTISLNAQLFFGNATYSTGFGGLVTEMTATAVTPSLGLVFSRESTFWGVDYRVPYFSGEKYKGANSEVEIEEGTLNNNNFLYLTVTFGISL